MQDNIKDLIKLIKETTTSAQNNIWIPSLRREVAFSPITILQQRQLIDAALTSQIDIVNKLFVDILKQNCSSTDIDIESLTLLDKDVIILSLRQTINNNIETDADITVAVADVLEKYKEVEIPSCAVESNGISILFSVPTIGSEIRINNNIELDKEDKNSAAKYVLNSIVIDMLRCVRSFSAQDKVYQARDISIEQLEEAINSLPAAAATQAYNYILSYKKDRATRLTVKDTDYVLDVNIRMLLNL